MQKERRVWKQSRERSMGKISHKGIFLSLSRDRRSNIRALVSKKQKSQKIERVGRTERGRKSIKYVDGEMEQR